MCELKASKSAIAGAFISNPFSEKLESIEADLVRSMVSEYVADVGNECNSPGGVCMLGVMRLFVVVFSESFLRLIIILILSFCHLLWSPLLHHIGLL